MNKTAIWVTCLIVFVGICIKGLIWYDYYHDTEIMGETKWSKISADEVDSPQVNTFYYTKRTTIDTIRTGFFPFLSVKTKIIDEGIWSLPADQDINKVAGKQLTNK